MPLLEEEASAVAPATPERAKPRPWIAVVLSLLIPGVGHLYAGRVVKGFALWTLGYAVTVLTPVAGLFVTFAGFVVWLAWRIAYYLWLAVSAGRTARRGPGRTLGRRRWLAVMGFVIFQVVVRSLPADSWVPTRPYCQKFASMEPTVRAGECLMVHTRAWEHRLPERGDLVIHQRREDPDTWLLRRVIALPGETIELRDKRVYVDGRAIEDPWPAHSDDPALPVLDQFGPQVVPEGTVFVLGDNRDNARDSRHVGPIDRSQLAARPLYLLGLEFDRFGRSLRPH